MTRAKTVDPAQKLFNFEPTTESSANLLASANFPTPARAKDALFVVVGDKQSVVKAAAERLVGQVFRVNLSVVPLEPLETMLTGLNSPRTAEKIFLLVDIDHLPDLEKTLEQIKGLQEYKKKIQVVVFSNVSTWGAANSELRLALDKFKAIQSHGKEGDRPFFPVRAKLKKLLTAVIN